MYYVICTGGIGREVLTTDTHTENVPGSCTAQGGRTCSYTQGISNWISIAPHWKTRHSTHLPSTCWYTCVHCVHAGASGACCIGMGPCWLCTHEGGWKAGEIAFRHPPRNSPCIYTSWFGRMRSVGFTCWVHVWVTERFGLYACKCIYEYQLESI